MQILKIDAKLWKHWMGPERADRVAVRAKNDSSDFSGKLGFTLKIGNREEESAVQRSGSVGAES